MTRIQSVGSIKSGQMTSINIANDKSLHRFVKSLLKAKKETTQIKLINNYSGGK